MYRIAIIGAGQLGSRHLQGLLTIGVPVSIEVFDLNEESLAVAKTRATEVKPNENIKAVSYYNSLMQLSDSLDIVIIATTAGVRCRIIQELLENKSVKNLVLEKVLFQKLTEYDIVQVLLDKYDVKCWVNCPRRMMPVYHHLKSLIKPGEKLTYTVIGGNWGLASNAIHFIDHLNYFNGVEDFTYETPIAEVIKSKREGYMELIGTLVGKQSNGSDIFLHSGNTAYPGIKLQVLSGDYLWEIDEVKQTLVTSESSNKWEGEKTVFQMLYQSQLTGIVCEEIIQTGNTSLTPYSISAKLHKGFLTAIKGMFETDSQATDIKIPIT